MFTRVVRDPFILRFKSERSRFIRQFASSVEAFMYGACLIDRLRSKGLAFHAFHSLISPFEIQFQCVHPTCADAALPRDALSALTVVSTFSRLPAVYLKRVDPSHLHSA